MRGSAQRRLQPLDYCTLPNVLSDHRAVVATLELARHPEKARPFPFAVP
jgi:hypothetical protein